MGHTEAATMEDAACVLAWKTHIVVLQLCGSQRQNTTHQVTQIDTGNIESKEEECVVAKETDLSVKREISQTILIHTSLLLDKVTQVNPMILFYGYFNIPYDNDTNKNKFLLHKNVV
jgi:hypothetical protein